MPAVCTTGKWLISPLRELLEWQNIKDNKNSSPRKEMQITHNMKTGLNWSR